MILLAIDPGDTESAYVVYDGENIIEKGKVLNVTITDMIIPLSIKHGATHVAIEMIASYGMAVGKTVFDTCVWVGRFIQFTKCKYPDVIVELVYRMEVKMCVCKSPKANDSNIRQALIDKFGAPGTKKNPGKTYGVSKDIWAALGVAVTYFETKITPALNTRI